MTSPGSPPPNRRPASFEELADRYEIGRLVVDYATAIDRQQWDDLDSVFTPDAHIDYTAMGGIAGPYPEVKAWLSEVMPLFAATQHLIANQAVDLHGDTATGQLMCHNPMVVAPPRAPASTVSKAATPTDTARTPRLRGTPGTGETPDTGETPGINGTPGLRGTPGTGETPDTGETPGMDGTPGLGGTPGTGQTPGIGGTPGTGETPGMGETGWPGSDEAAGPGGTVEQAENGRPGEADGPIMLFGLWYHDQYMRTPSGWRIARRVEEKSWSLDPVRRVASRRTDP